jgi:hypothetical protein
VAHLPERKKSLLLSFAVIAEGRIRRLLPALQFFANTPGMLL